MACGKRQVLGGLLDGFPQVPPRPVCDQCEQRAAPGVHPAELPVSHHPVHDRGGVPSPGLTGRLGTQPERGRPSVADQGHGDRILQAAGGRSLPPPGVHPAGRLVGRRPQKPGLPSGKTAGEEPCFHRRVGVPGGAGGHGPAALKRLRSGQAAGGRGRPVPLRGLAAVSGHDAGCDSQKAHQVPVDLPVRRTIHRVSRPRFLRAPSRV